MPGKRVLVEATNLRVGGGVQVAASFIDDLLSAATLERWTSRYPWLSDVEIEASATVFANLMSPDADGRVRVIDRKWPAFDGWRPSAYLYDVEFNIFGPVYRHRRAPRRLAGFADGSSLFGVPFGTQQSLHRRLRRTVRAVVSKRFFRRADHVVVEHDWVRRSLHDAWGLGLSRVHVVPNAVNGAFHDEAAWEAIPHLSSSALPRICYVTRAYPHKNIELLGAVGEMLLARYDLEVSFLLTLTDAEWRGVSNRVQRFAVNLGPLRIRQVPNVYAQADVAVFPSLLESSSATPLEALYAGCPLAASDRPFVRSVIGDCAHYFDPLDAEDAARVLAELLRSAELRRDLAQRGRELSAVLPTAQDRTAQYVALIDQVLSDS